MMPKRFVLSALALSILSLVSARFELSSTVPVRSTTCTPSFSRPGSTLTRRTNRRSLAFLDDDDGDDQKVQQCSVCNVVELDPSDILTTQVSLVTPVSSTTYPFAFHSLFDTSSSNQSFLLQAGTGSSLTKDLLYGAFLRVASDLTLGTPLESIKCRVTGSSEGPIQATKDIINEGGILALWTGTPSRTAEGSLLGAIYLLGAAVTKRQVAAMGGSPTMTALCGGLVGGVAQSIVMTPAGMVFTSLNLNRGKPGYDNDNAWTVTKRIVKEKGIMGMYAGIGPMALRQATNWASRSCFTEIARTTFKMSQYGTLGEIGSGVIGGVGSSWNTPVETIRVLMQADVSAGRPTKSFMGYWDSIVEEQGYAGLFRGVTPRAIQAVWQTVFMVVVPNMLGM